LTTSARRFTRPWKTCPGKASKSNLCQVCQASAGPQSRSDNPGLDGPSPPDSFPKRKKTGMPGPATSPSLRSFADNFAVYRRPHLRILLIKPGDLDGFLRQPGRRWRHSATCSSVAHAIRIQVFLPVEGPLFCFRKSFLCLLRLGVDLGPCEGLPATGPLTTRSAPLRQRSF
jgi:hypothetical protein